MALVQVAVVGVGGVGSVAAEMLTRCGIGRLLLYGELETLCHVILLWAALVPAAVEAAVSLPLMACGLFSP